MSMIKYLPKSRGAIRGSGVLAATVCAAFAHTAPSMAAVNNYPPSVIINGSIAPMLDPATNTYGPNAIETVYAGNVCANIPAQYVQDEGPDTFWALWQYEQSIGGTPVTPGFNCTFDGSASHAQWYGGTLPYPAPSKGWPLPLPLDPNNNEPLFHVGGNSGSAINNLQPLYQNLIWTQTGTVQSVMVPMAAAQAVSVSQTGNNMYAVIYLVTTVNNSTVGTWYETPYAASRNAKQAKFRLANNGPQTIPLVSGGIVTGITPPTPQQCAITPNCYQVLLDALNNQGFPPPGSQGSPFTPIKLPAQLAPGATYTFAAATK
jgi:hypothetical protein